MKNLLLILLVGLTFSLVGCKKSAEQKAAEEKALAEKKEAEEAERIKQYELKKARSLNIWKEIKFGMTRKQLSETTYFKNADNDDFVLYVRMFNPSLGVSTRELDRVEFRFGEKKGRLYSINFISNKNVTADHIDDMMKDCHNIVKVMEEGFKEKIKWKKEDVSVFDFNEGEEFDIICTDFGQVDIWVKMGETYKGAEYYYSVTAFCYPYSD